MCFREFCRKEREREEKKTQWNKTCSICSQSGPQPESAQDLSVAVQEKCCFMQNLFACIVTEATLCEIHCDNGK